MGLENPLTLNYKSCTTEHRGGCEMTNSVSYSRTRDRDCKAVPGRTQKQCIEWRAFRVILAPALALACPAGFAAEAELVSVSSNGQQGNGDTDCDFDPGAIAVSGNAQIVVFPSHANNLVDNDVNDTVDLFLHDRASNETRRLNPEAISGGSTGPCNSAISADGSEVVFETFGKLLPTDTRFPSGDLYLVNAGTGNLDLISVDSQGEQLNGHSYFPDMSADGNRVAFQTYADNSTPRIVVRDRKAGTTVDACVNSAGARANSECDNPSISADGRFVAFDSPASNLTRPEPNFRPDVFLHDLVTGVTTRVSVDSDGNGSTTIFGSSIRPDLSADGRYIAFESTAEQLVDDDTNDASDVFVHDRDTGETTRVSISSMGAEGDHDSFWASISGDGRFVSFLSAARSLSPTDTVDFDIDVYVHDRWAGQTTRVTEPLAPYPDSTGHSPRQAISADGSHIAYVSSARNLVRNDTNRVSDAFVSPTDPDRLLAAPVGELHIDDKWADVCSLDIADDSVLILGPPTINGLQPGVVRVSDGGSCGLRVRFQEWDYVVQEEGASWHKLEQLSYLGMSPGVHPMPDGSTWLVGSFDLSGTKKWQRVDFGLSFAKAPGVFLTMQSRNGRTAATVRARDVTRNGFEAALFEEEDLENSHNNEQIAYLAVYHPGAGGATQLEYSADGVALFGDIELPYVLGRGQVDHRWRLFRGVRLKLQEEQSLDEEVAHKAESVDILRIGDLVFAQQVSSNGQNTTAIRRKGPR